MSRRRIRDCSAGWPAEFCERFERFGKGPESSVQSPECRGGGSRDSRWVWLGRRFCGGWPLGVGTKCLVFWDLIAESERVLIALVPEWHGAVTLKTPLTEIQQKNVQNVPDEFPSILNAGSRGVATAGGFVDPVIRVTRNGSSVLL